MRIPQSKPLINNVSVPNDTYEQSPDIDPNVITLIDDGTNQDFNGYQEEKYIMKTKSTLTKILTTMNFMLI